VDINAAKEGVDNGFNNGSEEKGWSNTEGIREIPGHEKDVPTQAPKGSAAVQLLRGYAKARNGEDGPVY